MKINFTAQPRIEWITQGVPLLLIDDFYEDPDEVRASALLRSFERSEAGYPGRHEPLSLENDDVLKVATYVREVLRIAANVDFHLSELSSDFSVLTTPSKDVTKNQSHPHTDGVALAGITYLNPTPMGGTCFYSNKALGTSVLLPENEEQYDKIRNNQAIAQTEGYVSDNFDMWELLHKTEGRYNQFVMYVGNIFHSVSVTHDPDPSNIKTARLTQRFFVNSVSPIEHNRQ